MPNGSAPHRRPVTPKAKERKTGNALIKTARRTGNRWVRNERQTGDIDVFSDRERKIKNYRVMWGFPAFDFSTCTLLPKRVRHKDSAVSATKLIGSSLVRRRYGRGVPEVKCPPSLGVRPKAPKKCSRCHRRAGYKKLPAHQTKTFRTWRHGAMSGIAQTGAPARPPQCAADADHAGARNAARERMPRTLILERHANSPRRSPEHLRSWQEPQANVCH